MALGDPIPLYTTTMTPTVAQLATEWETNWKGQVLHQDLPYLFSYLTFSAFTNPAMAKLYLRGPRGEWALVPDGAVTITALDPVTGGGAGTYIKQYFVGNGVTGFVWVSSHAGTAMVVRSQVI